MNTAIITHAVAALVAAVIAANLTSDHYEAIRQADQLANAKATMVAVAKARKEEIDQAKSLRDIDQELLGEQRREIDSKDSTIAGLRTGTVRLRERFTCPSASPVPGAATTTAVSDAAANGGLQLDDAEFLVSFAARAKAVSTQLAKCQATIHTYTKGQ